MTLQFKTPVSYTLTINVPVHWSQPDYADFAEASTVAFGYMLSRVFGVERPGMSVKVCRPADAGVVRPVLELRFTGVSLEQYKLLGSAQDGYEPVRRALNVIESQTSEPCILSLVFADPERPEISVMSPELEAST